MGGVAVIVVASVVGKVDDGFGLDFGLNLDPEGYSWRTFHFDGIEEDSNLNRSRWEAWAALEDLDNFSWLDLATQIG